MKTLLRVAAVVIVVLAVSVPLLVPGDGAAVPRPHQFPPVGTKLLVTAPLVSRDGNFHIMYCNVLNVTAQPVDVIIAGGSANGSLEQLTGTISLGPHKADSAFFTPDEGFGYCGFAITGSTDAVRAVAQLYGQDVDDPSHSRFQGASEAR